VSSCPLTLKGPRQSIVSVTFEWDENESQAVMLIFHVFAEKPPSLDRFAPNLVSRLSSKSPAQIFADRFRGLDSLTGQIYSAMAKLASHLCPSVRDVLVW